MNNAIFVSSHEARARSTELFAIDRYLWTQCLAWLNRPHSQLRRGIAQMLIVAMLSQTVMSPVMAAAYGETAETRARKEAAALAKRRNADGDKKAQPSPTPSAEAQQQYLMAAAGLVLTQVATAFNGLTGLAYHEANNKLLAAVNAPNGQPRNFELIGSDGVHTAYSNVSNQSGDLRLATARDDGNGKSLAGFNRGELFFNTSANGVIARVSANGATIQNPWVTLPGETGRVTHLTLDRTGLFSGNVIAVTATGRIYRVNTQAQAALVANLNTPLSGVTVLPNDAAKYGPWAGRILTGAPQQGLIYAVNVQGQSVSQGFGVNPAELLVIPPQQNFYAVESGSQKLWGAPPAAFGTMVGDILIGQAQPGTLGKLHWNGTSFTYTQLAQVTGWQQLVFAPSGVAPLAEVPRYYDKIALVRHGLQMNSGDIEGALWQLNPEEVQLNGNATITSDLLVPGTPTVTLSGAPNLVGMLDGTGNPQPANYQVKLNGNAAVRYVVRRVDPVAMPTITPPTSSVGTRDLQLNGGNQNPGDWATVRHVSINGNIAAVTMPPGAYGNISVNGNSTLQLGVAGVTTPLVYSVQELQVNGNSELRVLSPIILRVKNRVTINGGSSGSALTPSWLRLEIDNGNVSNALVVNGNSTLYAIVRTPDGRVTMNGNSRLCGTVSCDELKINGNNSVLQVCESDTPPPIVNRPPTVNAGADQTINLPATASLTGIVSDDGLPTGATLTSSWSKTSGPGNVTFSAANSLSTTATFDTAGTYTLKLTANDSQLTASDEVVVTVNGGNTAPTANAGADQTISQPTNSVSLNGTGSDDGLPTGSALTYVWSQISGPGTVIFGNANTAATQATFSTNGTYVLRLTVSDSALSGTDDIAVVVNRAPIVNAGANQSIELPTNSVTLAGTVTDDGLPVGATITSTWSKTNGPGTVTFANASNPATTATFTTAGVYVLQLAASDTLATGTATVTITVNAPNQAPSVNAGADKIISLPTNSVAIDATVNDDGKPAGAALSYAWTKVSGPVSGTVTFSTPNAEDTSATFSQSGVYTLRLTVSDTLLSGSDEVVITVNRAPVVNAGLDQIITLPTATASLVGSFDDDNLPAPVAYSHQWTVISGPGSVTFSAPTSPATDATFGQGGIYVLRLTTSDSLVSGSDDITVIVNTAPSASAGLDQLISLPNNTAALTGTGSDPDLLPTNAPLTYSWTKTGGPIGGNVTFSAANSQNTNATFSTPGLYRLLLTVSDGAASGTDEVVVIVNAAPTANAGADQAINFNQTATLNGTGSDPDGFPIGATLSYAWSQVSGPVSGNVTFGTPNLQSTSATFSTSGVYTLRLSVSDTAASGFDDVIVTVNGAPVVNAGTDQLITLPTSSVSLTPTITDDGLAPGTAALTYLWERASGPAVTFSNANSKNTTVTFSGGGAYTLRLTVSDGALTTTDELNVTVMASNQAPQVNAGADQVYLLPISTVSLVGTATDDGLPGGVLTQSWSKISGPGTVTFSNANVLNPSATLSAAGAYVLRLTVSDGLLSAFDDVTITINQAPTVNAGTDQTIALPVNSVNLTGTATDDGIPSNALTYSWSVVTGTGNVTFSNVNALATSATFSLGGAYVLRLTVSDGALTTSDDVAINVQYSSLVDAGPNKVVAWPVQSAQMEGSALDASLSTQITVNWTKVSGPGNVTWINQTSYRAVPRVDAPGTYVFRITGTLGSSVSFDEMTVYFLNPADNQPPVVEPSSFDPVTWPDNQFTLTNDVTDDGLTVGPISYTWSKVKGPGTATFANIHDPFTTVTFSAPGLYIVRMSASDAQYVGEGDYELYVNTAPVVDAGIDREIRLPDNSAKMQPVVTDDADLDLLTYEWTFVSGPATATVNFDDATLAQATATFNSPGNVVLQGDYVLRLSVFDGYATTSDTMRVRVLPRNAAPVVSAGADQVISLPRTNQVTLAGSMTDDGYPSGAAITLQWSAVSGPGTVTFAQPNNLITTATFSAAGTYTLRLTASDTQFSGSDDVIVVVSANNQAPVVNAGTDQQILTPANQVSLFGAITDDGVPLNTPLVVAWTKVSGPGEVEFGNAANAATTAKFTQQGVYVLRLTANDTQFTASDDVMVTVGCAGNNAKLDIVFVMDVSGSYAGQPLVDAKVAAKAMVDHLQLVANDQASIVSFASLGVLEQPLTRDANLLKSKIDALAIRPFSDTTGGLQRAYEELTSPRRQPGSQPIILLISDGGGGYSSSQLQTIRNAGIRIISITFGPAGNLSLPTMRTLANSPTDFFLAPTGADLQLVYAYLAGSFCRNLPPIANAGTDQNIVLPNTTTLNGAASDDGVPGDGDLTIRWTQVSGPVTATLVTPEQFSTNVTFPQAGTYVFRLTANDSVSTVSDDVTVNALTEPTLTGATLVLSTNNAASNAINTPVTVTATLRDSVNLPIANLGVQLALAGANASTVVGAAGRTDANGTFSFTYTGRNGGLDTLTATTQNSTQTLTSNALAFTWTVPPSQLPFATQGWIASPIHQSEVMDEVPVILGTEPITNGTVEACNCGGSNGCTPLATNVSGSPGDILCSLQAQALRNGACTLRLTGTSTLTGTTLVSEVQVSVAGEFKPGRVALNLKDFTVPVSGIPITIGRKYDSLDRNINADFGFGWSLSVFATQLEVAADHSVTFNDPASGKRVHFDFTPQSSGGLTGFLLSPAYTGEPGVYGKLEAEGCWPVVLSGGKYSCLFASGYQPTAYKYTDPYGRQYKMSPSGELQSVEDLNGNKLTITATGIVSSDGKSVPFVRDAQNRITQITDADGKIYRYNYNAAGELSSINLPGIAIAPSYTYATGHYLLTAKDSRGNDEAIMTYDTDGRLASVTDAEGQTTSYTYDPVTNTTLQTNPDGGLVRRRYDAYGNLLSVVDPDNQTTAYSYDPRNNLLTETNAVGQTKRYTYDARGNRITATDNLNRTASANYNQFGGPTTLTDQLGNGYTVSYDAQFMPREVRDNLGLLGRFTYDTRGNILTQTDANGAITTFAYDQYGNKVLEQDPLGFVTSWEYDQMGRMVRMTNPRNYVTTYSYDALGRTVQSNDRGRVTTYEYDGNGNTTAMIDPLGRRTTYEYDRDNRVTKVTYPDNTFVTTTYNFRGQAVTTTDQNSVTITNQYDALGRLKRVIHPDTTSTFNDYDGIGRIRYTLDERGNATTYEYDNSCDCSGRVTKVIDALGRFVESRFDAAGRRIASIDQKGRETKFEYDSRGRLTRTIAPDNTVTSQTYDGVNRVIARTDQTGKVTRYEYNLRGDLMAVINALNQRTEFTYDANRNLQTIKDARSNQITSNTYTVHDQLSQRVTPVGTEVMTYDILGNLKTKRDQKGKTTTHNYDPLMSRLTSIVPDATLSEPMTSFTYKPNGQRWTMTDGSGVTTYGYDNRNRLTSKQTPFGALSYTYDAASNVETMQSNNANGVSVSYGYDVLNRLERVTDNRVASGITNYQFDEVGNLKQSALPNGVQNDYSYNTANLLTQLNVTKGASNLARYVYSYTPSRLRASMAELSGRTESYEYDDANQLVSQTISGAAPNQNGTVRYVLDAVGNRVQRNSTIAALASTVNTFNNKDQLDTDGYDANGNTLAADGKTFTYTYDNRLKTVNGGAITLGYDGNNNRVTKTVDAVTTNYLVDELSPSGYAQVVEEQVGGQVNKAYVWGHMLISQRQLLAGNWVTHYYGQDGSENVRQLFDNTGTITDTFDYDAFGILIGRTGSTANSYLYRSQQFDADLGFYYNRARYYDQTRGRFLSRDEFDGFAQKPRSLHRYLYSSVDPINRLDLSGYGDTTYEFTSLLSSILTGVTLVIERQTINAVFMGMFFLIGLFKLTQDWVDNNKDCQPYQVGLYGLMRQDCPGYDVHHLPQGALAAARLGPFYSYRFAPAIRIPTTMHANITREQNSRFRARQLLSLDLIFYDDIGMLLMYTAVFVVRPVAIPELWAMYEAMYGPNSIFKKIP